MASIVVPGLDLAPSVPSRIVTVDVIDMTEGAPAAGAKIDFILPQDLHATSDGKVLKAGTTTLELDANGHGEIRVPAYTAATRPEDGVILVKKHWAPYPYPIRVPAGASKISLASLDSPLEVDHAMAQYIPTDATVRSITQGAQWGATAEVLGGIINLDFIVPPGGEAYSKLGVPLSTDADLTQLQPGVYSVAAAATATTLGLPTDTHGILEVASFGTAGRVQVWRPRSTAADFVPQIWQRHDRGGSLGWTVWARHPEK